MRSARRADKYAVLVVPNVKGWKPSIPSLNFHDLLGEALPFADGITLYVVIICNVDVIIIF